MKPTKDVAKMFLTGRTCVNVPLKGITYFLDDEIRFTGQSFTKRVRAERVDMVTGLLTVKYFQIDENSTVMNEEKLPAELNAWKWITTK